MPQALRTVSSVTVPENTVPIAGAASSQKTAVPGPLELTTPPGGVPEATTSVPNPADLAEVQATQSCEVAAAALLEARVAALRAAADAHVVEAAAAAALQAQQKAKAAGTAAEVVSEDDYRQAVADAQRAVYETADAVEARTQADKDVEFAQVGIAAAKAAYEAARQELSKAEASKAEADAAVLQARHERDLAVAVCDAIERDGDQAVGRAEAALAAAERVTDARTREVVPQAAEVVEAGREVAQTGPGQAHTAPGEAQTETGIAGAQDSEDAQASDAEAAESDAAETELASGSPEVTNLPQLQVPSEPNTSWTVLTQAQAAEGWAREVLARLRENPDLDHALELEDQAQMALQDASVVAAAASARFESASVYANLAQRAIEAAEARQAATVGRQSDANTLAQDASVRFNTASARLNAMRVVLDVRVAACAAASSADQAERDAHAALAASRLQLAKAIGTHGYDKVDAPSLDMLASNLSGVDHQAALAKGFNDARFPLLVRAYARAQADLDAAIKARANAAGGLAGPGPGAAGDISLAQDGRGSKALGPSEQKSVSPEAEPLRDVVSKAGSQRSAAAQETVVTSHVDRRETAATGGKDRLLRHGNGASGKLGTGPLGRRRGKHTG